MTILRAFKAGYGGHPYKYKGMTASPLFAF